jgi:hypothetical protein
VAASFVACRFGWWKRRGVGVIRDLGGNGWCIGHFPFCSRWFRELVFGVVKVEMPSTGECGFSLCGLPYC